MPLKKRATSSWVRWVICCATSWLACPMTSLTCYPRWECPCGRAVGGEIVFTAKQIIVHSGDIRDANIEFLAVTRSRRCRIRHSHSSD